jgi:putative transposase
MPYNPEIHHRHTIRLQSYDYSAEGGYFLTICIEQKVCLLGHIAENIMHLNQYGMIVEEEWKRSAQICREIVLDEWVVMPNHFHALVWLTESHPPESSKLESSQSHQGGLPSAPTAARKPRSISTLVAGFKGAVVRRINALHSEPVAKFWQRNYHEHIIRNEDELNYIRWYIRTNPERWQQDSLHSS